MKIAFPMRADAHTKSGGDVVQIERYIRELERIGIQGTMIVDLNADVSGFDIVHLSNIDRPVDTYASFCAAKKQKVPTVISTIHHSYDEILRYEKTGRQGAAKVVSDKLSFSQLEMMRSSLRMLRDKSLITPTLTALVKGVIKLQREILHGCDKVLVLTDKEAKDLSADFSFSSDKVKLLKNGLDIGSPKTIYPERNIDVLVVGRLEARKNQLNILLALEDLGLTGVFVGSVNENHKKYCDTFLRAIYSSKFQSKYIGAVNHDSMSELFKKSKVHVSASWFEVASLVDLEAYSNGCVVVSSKCGGTYEDLLDSAYYVDPGSIIDIKQKVSLALDSYKSRTTLTSTLNITRSWASVAMELRSIYLNLLKGSTNDKTIT